MARPVYPLDDLRNQPWCAKLFAILCNAQLDDVGCYKDQTGFIVRKPSVEMLKRYPTSEQWKPQVDPQPEAQEVFHTRKKGTEFFVICRDC